MSARKYSESVILQAAEMRESGATIAQIAKATGMSQSSVDWHCLKLGADKPGATTIKRKPVGPMRVRRGAHVVRRFTAEEDAILLSMESAGVSLTQIGRHLGRPRNSVLGRLMTLARHEARAEGEA